MLKTESKKATSFEVATEINELRTIFSNRKNLWYIPAESAEVLYTLNTDIQDDIQQKVDSFYSELDGYLAKWLLARRHWSLLIAVLENSAGRDQRHWTIDKILAETFLAWRCESWKGFWRDESSATSPERDIYVLECRENSCQDRWIVLIKTISDQNSPITQISLVVQYAFAIPEMTFSVINGVWNTEKGKLSLNTLEAHLNVKFNNDQSCEEFYTSIKCNQILLAHTQSSEKYNTDAINKPSTSNESSIGIDCDWSASQTFK